MGYGLPLTAAQPARNYGGEPYQIIFVKGNITYTKTARRLSVGDTLYIDERERFKEYLKFNDDEATCAAFNPRHGRLNLSKAGANYASSAIGWDASRMTGLEHLSAPMLMYKNLLHLPDSSGEGRKFLVLGKSYEFPFNEKVYPVKNGGGFYFSLQYKWKNPDGTDGSHTLKEIPIQTIHNRLIFDQALLDTIKSHIKANKDIVKKQPRKHGVVTPNIIYRIYRENTMFERSAYFYPLLPEADKVNSGARTVKDKVRKGARIVKDMMERSGKSQDEIVDSVFSYLIAYYGAPEPSNALRWMKENLELSYSEEGYKKRFGFPINKNNLLVLSETKFNVETGYLPDISPDQYLMLGFTLNNKRSEDTVNLAYRWVIVFNKESLEAENDHNAIETIPNAVLFYYNDNGAPVKVSEFNIIMPNLEALKQKIAPIVETMRNDGKSVGQIQQEAIRVMNEFYGKPEEEDALRWLNKTFNLQ